jgi:hypothetical protein
MIQHPTSVTRASQGFLSAGVLRWIKAYNVAEKQLSAIRGHGQ